MEAPKITTANNKCLYIQLSDGKGYVVHSNGDIERTDMFLQPSGQWKMTGIRTPGRRGALVFLNEITPEFVASVDLRRCRLMDWDYGTYREQSVTMTQIYFYDSPEQTNYYRYNREYLRRGY